MQSEKGISAGAPTYCTEEGFLVSRHPLSDAAAIRAYNSGLPAHLHIKPTDQSATKPARHAWIAYDHDSAPLAAVQTVGPLRAAECINALSELTELQVTRALHSRVERGVVLCHGAWTARPSLRAVLADVSWHTSFLHAVSTVVFETDEPSVAATCETAGLVRLPDAPPLASLSDIECPAVALFCLAEKFPALDDHTRSRLLRQRAYLAPHRASPVSHFFLFYHSLYEHMHQRLIARGVQRHDSLKEQLRQAIHCGYANQVDSIAERAHPWLYIPWRNALVRILEPGLFWKVRQDRNRHKLTLREMDVLRSKSVGVIGMSVGASIAFGIAQEGMCGELRIADMDTLELTNLNRLAGSVLDLGLPKVDMARRRIAQLNPYLSVLVYRSGITSENVDTFLRGLNVVVEECDSLDIKLLVRHRARHFRIPVVMETTDNGLLDVERFDLHPTKPLHGLTPDIPVSALANLTTQQKAPFLLSILEPERGSTRGAASLLEVGTTLKSWPQLAEEISLGTALVLAACRHILLGMPLTSGRIRKGLDDMLASLEVPQLPPLQHVSAPLQNRPPLPDAPLPAIEMAAHLAPSPGNQQAWRFTTSQDSFTVYARDDLPVASVDIGRRATAVGCGAALANAWCMASHLNMLADPGDGPRIETSHEDSNFCGTFNFGSKSDALASLAPYIRYRTSNRQFGSKQVLEEKAVKALKHAAAQGGARLVYMPVEDLDDILQSFSEADRTRFLCEKTNKEFFEEIREPCSGNLYDGLDVRTLELSETELAGLKLLRRRDVVAFLSEHGLGSRLGDLQEKRTRASAGLVFVIMKGRRWSDYVRGGYAMELVWLAATQLGLSIQVVLPVFAHAHSVEDLSKTMGPTLAKILSSAKDRCFSRVGLLSDESFICSMRVHRGPPPRAISLRLAPTASPKM